MLLTKSTEINENNIKQAEKFIKEHGAKVKREGSRKDFLWIGIEQYNVTTKESRTVWDNARTLGQVKQLLGY